MTHCIRTTNQLAPPLLTAITVSLMAVMLAHVYLLQRGIILNNTFSFWLPIELAGLLILLAVIYSDDKWVLFLVMAYAATLHVLLLVALPPTYTATTDAIYGYQRVSQTISSGRWVFGQGTGESGQVYSFFPMIFVFTALWSGVASISPFTLVNYGFGFVNLTSFLMLRMLCTDLLNFSKRNANLVLFLYSLTPIIHRVEAAFHYEAYAIIFFSLVLLYMLKPNISVGETIIATISILTISLSHYFTAYILLLNTVVLIITYLILRGTKVNMTLLFLSTVTPLGLISSDAINLFGVQVLRVQNVFAHVKSIQTLITKLYTQAPQSVPTFYPSPFFNTLTLVRNVAILALGLLAVVFFCFSFGHHLRPRLARKDMLTYVAATWVFSVFFSVAAFYGVAWSETVLATQGAGEASNRIAEFGFLQFAVFGGLGLSILLKKLEAPAWAKWRIGNATAKVILAIMLIAIFVPSTVVQAYPRILYEGHYNPRFYDEYRPSFEEPYFLGSWWYGAANQTTMFSRPVTGSRALKSFMQGYGYQGWWADSLATPAVDINNNQSRHFTVYYAIDLSQLYKPDHLYNVTISPTLISSQNTHLDAILSTGRILLFYKPKTA